jgi:hypothetical protein
MAQNPQQQRAGTPQAVVVPNIPSAVVQAPVVPAEREAVVSLLDGRNLRPIEPGSQLLVHASAVGNPESVEGLKITDDTEVVIRPRKTEPRVLIGYVEGEPQWFSFTAGQTTKVPRRILGHLQEKGFI